MILSNRLRQIADRLDDGYLTLRKAGEDLKAIVSTFGERTLRALLDEALSLWSDAEDQIDDMRHRIGLEHWTAGMVFRTQEIIRMRRTLAGELAPDVGPRRARAWVEMPVEEIKAELARWKPHT